MYKGPDMASVAIEPQSETQQEKPMELDEINKYINCSFVTGSEGCWGIMGVDVHGREPNIQ